MSSRSGLYPRPTEREILTASVGGYVPMRWEPPHVHQLPCYDLIEHKKNAECAMCLEDVRDSDHTDILLMYCGHWVCADARCRPRRNREWVGSREGSTKTASSGAPCVPGRSNQRTKR